MKVFVAGATGVLGRRLVQQLTAKRHSVVGLARSPENATRIRRELGWALRYPTHAEGLRQVVDAWNAEGFPPKA